MFVSLTGSYSDDLLDGDHEDLAVAELSSLGRPGHSLDCAVNKVARHNHLHLHLWKKVHVVLAASIRFGMSFLTAIPFHLGDGHPYYPGFLQVVLDRLEKMLPYDAFELFHSASLVQIPFDRLETWPLALVSVEIGGEDLLCAFRQNPSTAHRIGR